MTRKNVWGLLFSVLLFIPSVALAQLSDGNVYCFTNVENSGLSLTPGAGSTMSISATDKTNYSQLWYVSEASTGIYRLRNLGTGLYMRSSKQTSAPWTLVKEDQLDANCNFKCTKAGAGYTLRASSDGNTFGYMHYASGTSKVVCWSSDSKASQWTISAVAVSEEDLAKNWEEVAQLNPSNAEIAAWESTLGEIFIDKACTQLKAPYSGYTLSQLEQDTKYKSLSATLQKMVQKMIPGGTWTEANVDSSKPAWDAEYAKRFRVQRIEPCNEASSAASALNMNAHAYLNNPMGIYANTRQTLYIMVEGEIKDGATLYLNTWSGHGKPSQNHLDGVKLHQGLNVVPIFGDNVIGCFAYVVQTFNGAYAKGNKARWRKLSDYDNLKVHIEGGNINGYYNVVGDDLWGEGDTNEDWDYYAARATHTGVTILGKYMTLQFPFFDTETEGNKGLNYYLTGKNIIEKTIEAWDNVMLQERLLMGLSSEAEYEAANSKWKSLYSKEPCIFAYTGNSTDGFHCDYSDYYNIHGLAFGVGGTAYMYGGWDHSGYHYNTMRSIFSEIFNNAGSNWGPAHEIGHQHQAPLTLNGQTEVTNNLFSNVVLWYFGKSTSRVNGDEGSLERVAEAFNTEGGDFYTNNIWALTHMYYRLFLYYHVLGHNTSFYPRLYEMLRQDPMVKAYQQTGVKGLLHLYKKACDAAGEDLTEFFRAHGALTPMTDRFVGDYSNSIYNCTRKQIDEAIASVKAKGYKENITPLFINDGTGELITGSLGKTLELYDGQKTADVGNYAFFGNPAKTYTCTVSNNVVTLKGSGGIGFLVRNAKGEIVAFSNKKTMAITDEVCLMLVKEEAVVEVMDGDGSTKPASCTISNMQRNLLAALLKEANAIVKLTDDTNMKVGYYRSASLEALKAATDAAQEAYAKRNKEAYASTYEALFYALKDLQKDPTAKITIINGSTYVLEGYQAKGIMLSVNSSNKLIGEAKNSSNDKQKWVFEPASGADTYYIKNKSTGLYLDALPNGKQGSATATGKSKSVAFKIIYLGSGNMAVQCQNDDAKSLNYNSGIGVLGWDYEGDENSWWYITAVELNEAELAKVELEAMIAQTNALLKQMGDDVLLPGALPLQVESQESPYWLSSNADQNVVGTEEDGGGIAALIDNNISTFFHSQWSGTAVKDDHYLQVDLGEGKEMNIFSFSYATRNTADSPAPTSIKVAGSTNGKTFERALVTVKNSGTNALPSYTKTGTYWTSNKIISSKPYRYLRFSVTGSQGPGSNQYGGHYFFAMSEFALNNTITVVNSLQPEYAGAEELYKETADQMYEATTVLNNEKSTADDIATALDELETQYEALLAASKNPSAIDGVTADPEKPRAIYDLSGRRLKEIVAPGIYIINGKKRYVK